MGSKRHSLQAVELSRRLQTAVKMVSKSPAPSNWGQIYRYFWQAGHADVPDGYIPLNWNSYTDDHRRQLIADLISNSDHIKLNTNTPNRVSNTTLQQTYSPDIGTVSNTLYNRTSWTTQHILSSDHLPIITTINKRHDY